MKMAYIAIEPKTNWCFAITSADPEFIVDAVKEIKKWKKSGAKIALLPTAVAKEIFCNSIRPIKDEKQAKMF